MTTDRDIRLTTDQMMFLGFAVRDELRRRRASISRAEANRAAGRKIQQGTLDEHYRAVKALEGVRDSLEVARRQIARRIAERVGAVA